MKQKVKKLWNENRKKILLISTGILTIGVFTAVGKKSNDRRSIPVKIIPYHDSNERKILEEFGAIYKEGSGIPFATREIAEKFLKERGNTYQLDILSGDGTGVIWISTTE